MIVRRNVSSAINLPLLCLRIFVALRALIHAIAPETNKPEGKNTVDKLAQKLSELVGVGAPDGSGHSRNERGEVCLILGLLLRD